MANDPSAKLTDTQLPPSRGRWLLVLVLVIVGSSLGALAYKGWRPGTQSPPPVVIADPSLREAYSASPDGEGWLAQWRTAGTDVRIEEFSVAEQAPIEGLQPGMALEQSELQPPLANRYVWSPDKSRFVDYLWSYGEPDSVLGVYNRTGNATLERLAFCGTACGFDAAYWLDNDRVLVLGTEEAYTPDGAPACGPAPATESGLGCRHIALYLYDFGTQQRTRYVSYPRQLNANPFEAAKQARWESGNGPKPAPTLNVTIEAPRNGATVGASFAISGQARTFEQNVRVRIVNQRTYRVLLDSFTTATAPEVGVFGPYDYDVTLPKEHVEPGDQLLVEAFENSARDGSEINLVSRLVTYQP